MTNGAAAAPATVPSEVRLDALTTGQYAEIQRRIGRWTFLSGTELDEIVHATLLRMLHSGFAFRDEEHLYACALKASRWAVRDARRRRRTDLPLHEVTEADFAPPGDLCDLVTRRLDARRVLRALPQIGPRQRDVVWLHDVEDRTSAEVAAALGVSVSAVDVALSRGRKSVRRLLSPAGAIAALGTALRQCRPRAVPMSRIAVVMTLVAGPVGLGIVGRWRVGHPLQPGAAVLADAEVAVRHGAPVLAAAAPGPRTAAGSPALAMTTREIPRGDPTDDGTTVCTVSETIKSCAGVGGSTVPHVPGDTLYVVVPLSVTGRDDVPVYVHQDSVPFCSKVPTTTYSGCRHQDAQPSDSWSML